jgi:hypothetical protein
MEPQMIGRMLGRYRDRRLILHGALLGLNRLDQTAILRQPCDAVYRKRLKADVLARPSRMLNGRALIAARRASRTLA